MKRLLITPLCLAFVMGVTAQTAEAIPTTTSVTLLGKDSGGSPVNGAVNVIIRIFDADTAGTMVYEETHTTTASNGLVYIDLGSGSGGALDTTVFDGTDRWVEIAFQGTVMTPRLKVGVVPYAVKAASADTLGTLAPSEVALASHNHSGTYLPVGTSLTCTSGNVVTGITAAGNVSCGADQVNTYGAASGGGLAINGSNEFSIATGGVTSTHVADNSLTSADLAANSVTSSELASNSVATGNIINGTITNADIANNTITAAQIATGGVASAEVLDNSLTASDLATDSVGALELANNAVASANIVDGTVTSADIANSTITGTDIASNTITTADIATGGVASAEVLDNSLTASDLATNSVGAAELQSLALSCTTVSDGVAPSNDTQLFNSSPACPSGYTMTGGGCYFGNSINSSRLRQNAPGTTTWSCRVQFDTATTTTTQLTAYARCCRTP